MQFVTGTAFLLCAITWGRASNILGIFPMVGKSHFVMYERLLIELAARGHNVDVVTHFPPKESVPPTYNALSVRGSLPIFVNNISVDYFRQFSHYSLIEFITNQCGIESCEVVFNTTVVKDLKTTTKKYDLVVTEIFGSDCMLGFGYHFKAPVVSVISSVALPWANDRIGNPDNPSYIPNYFVSFTTRMSLYQRIENTILLLRTKFLYKFFSRDSSDRVAREFFGPDMPDLENLVLNTSLVLVNSHFSMNQARPTVPNFVEVGGLHIKEPKPLPKKFEELVATSASMKGVILLTMGSMLMTESLPVETLQGLFDAFAELPNYRVLWKADRERFPKGLRIPDNVHFESWLPQMDILCHPSVKVFVSHGGLMGSQEAVYCGVPLLGIPVFADQESNIQHSEMMGLTIKVRFNEISKESILAATKRLLEDSKYKQNAERVSKQFKDRPLSALDTAIYWVEYVIRHNGAPQLRSISADLPWYQYYLVDVGAILLSLVIGAVYIANVTLKLILKLFACRAFKAKFE